MSSRILFVLATVGMLLPSIAFAKMSPTFVSGAMTYQRSDGEFAAAIVIDRATKKVLYEYQADRPRSAASLTKLMGAMVFIDHDPSWKKIVSITKDDQIGGGSLRVSPGATLSVQDLLFSSITASANNAAVALPRAVGLSKKTFVKEMNAKAKELKLTGSRFTEPSGLEPTNIVTARDMAKLAMAAFDVDMIHRAATTATYQFRIRNTTTNKTIKSTNDLLVNRQYNDLHVTGGKTGFIYESMYNLAVQLKPMSEIGSNRELMVVVLGSPTRDASFKTASALTHWAWRAYRWE